jgi:hypothetical protein
MAIIGGRGRGVRSAPVHSSDIECFVRETLGCGCPDEVFRSVSIDHLPASAGRPALTELRVGARLLIRVVATPDHAAAAGWLEGLVADGRATRDRHGYNRFRLVLAAPATGAAPRGLDGLDGLAARFARATAGDDRAHLHVLAEGQLPAALGVAPPAGAPSAAGRGTVAK